MSCKYITVIIMFMNKNKILLIVFVALLLLSLASNLYLFKKEKSSQKSLEELKKILEQKNQELSKVQKDLSYKKEEIKRKDDLIEAHKKLLAAMRKDKEGLEKQYDEFLRATQEAAKSVTLFKKRAEADEMLLAKYSKIFFLNEHYAPEHISYIPTEFSKNGISLRIKSEVLPFLQAMLEDMKEEGLNPKVVSAYRSFEQQKHLKGAYLQTYGSGANKFSADQGYSEHQLGTTVDIVNDSASLTYDFENTDEFKWLKDNAWKYGFVLSYPKDNGYYIYEPWHWRFVGKGLAKRLHDEGKYFYDLSQNEIYKYLINIFDNPPKI